MSLSISSSDREVLARCRLSSQVIAIDSSQPGDSRLVTIDRRELNCWDLFISIFGFGRLASKSISLYQVTSYLNQYSWERCSPNDPAYINVCALANRAMLRGSLALFDSVSHYDGQKPIELVQYVRGGSLSSHQVNQRILWNPALQVKHVREQLRREFLKGTIQIKEGNGSLDSNSYLPLERLRNVQIIVRQDMTPEIVQPHHSYQPHPASSAYQRPIYPAYRKF